MVDNGKTNLSLEIDRFSHSWSIYWVGCTCIQRPLKKLELNGFEQLCSTLLIKTKGYTKNHHTFHSTQGYTTCFLNILIFKATFSSEFFNLWEHWRSPKWNCQGFWEGLGQFCNDDKEGFPWPPPRRISPGERTCRLACKKKAFWRSLTYFLYYTAQ